jgi:hypothetical protein
MNHLPCGLSPTSRAVAGAIDVVWADLRKQKPFLLLTEETCHPKLAYLHRMAAIGSEELSTSVRQLGDTYLGMPMVAYLKACERHGFNLETFFGPLIEGGSVIMLTRDRDESIVVGYAHDGTMRGAVLLVPRRDKVHGFGTECHDCLDGFGLIMDIHEHAADGYPVRWNDRPMDRLHAQVLMFPVSEYRLWGRAKEAKREVAQQWVDDLCMNRIASLPQPWRARIEGIYKGLRSKGTHQ